MLNESLDQGMRNQGENSRFFYEASRLSERPSILERDSSTTKSCQAVPTREYQSDLPSLIASRALFQRFEKPPDKKCVHNKSLTGQYISENAVGSRKSAQALNAPSKCQKMLFTNKVTTHFWHSLCTSIAYTSFSRPTAFSRLKKSSSLLPVSGVSWSNLYSGG